MSDKRKQMDSSSSSDSSDYDKEKKKLKKLKKKAKKKLKKEYKLEKKRIKKEQKRIKKEKKSSKVNEKQISIDEPKCHVNSDEITASKVKAPMTKEEWEKQQSIVRRVFDEETNRYRLIKGTGEVLEECVSRERHQSINKQATQGDGTFFQSTLKSKLHQS